MAGTPSSPQASSRVHPIRRWLREAWILPVRLYQVTLSRWTGGHCRFVPTCSNYFIDAVRNRGILVGTAKGIWRICRCNPWGGQGYDPVE